MARLGNETRLEVLMDATKTPSLEERIAVLSEMGKAEVDVSGEMLDATILEQVIEQFEESTVRRRRYERI